MPHIELPFLGDSHFCYKRSKTDEKSCIKYCDGIWGVKRELEIQALECVMNQNDPTISPLAKEYFDLFKECNEVGYDNCFYNGFGPHLDCTCPFEFISVIKTLKYDDLIQEGCKTPSQSEMNKVNSKRTRMMSDLEMLCPKSAACLGKPIKCELGLKVLNMSKLVRSSTTFKVCTCNANLCDASGGEMMTKPDDDPQDCNYANS